MKKIIIISISIIFMGASPFSPLYNNYTVKTIDISGLVFEYKLDGNLEDTSPNNYPDIKNYGASLTADRNGYSNRAYYFNSAQFDYMSIAFDSASLINRANFTLSIWIKSDDPLAPGQRALYSDRVVPITTYLAVLENGTSDDQRVTVASASTVTITAQPTTNNWTHIAIVRENTTKLRIYHNGDSVGGGTVPTVAAIKDSATIGQLGSNTQYFKGAIDDIRLYYRVLDTTEIRQLANE